MWSLQYQSSKDFDSIGFDFFSSILMISLIAFPHHGFWAIQVPLWPLIPPK